MENYDKMERATEDRQTVELPRSRWFQADTYPER